MTLVFMLANIGIFLGYVFVALVIAPNLQVRLWRTRIGGITFFATCALTHLEMVAHAATGTPIGFTAWHMIVIHSVQVVAVWLFVTGLYVEFVKGRAMWPPRIHVDEKLVEQLEVASREIDRLRQELAESKFAAIKPVPLEET